MKQAKKVFAFYNEDPDFRKRVKKLCLKMSEDREECMTQGEFFQIAVANLEKEYDIIPNK